VAFVPYLVLPLLTVTLGRTNLPSLSSIYLVVGGLLQILSLALGASYVSAAYGLRLERSLLIQVVFFVVATLAFSMLQSMGAITPVWS
jgi:hypothetical protein